MNPMRVDVFSKTNRVMNQLKRVENNDCLAVFRLSYACGVAYVCLHLFCSQEKPQMTVFERQDEQLKRLKEAGKTLVGDVQPEKAKPSKSREEVEAEYWRHRRWVEKQQRRWHGADEK